MSADIVKNMDLARRLYGPSIESMRESLPDIGESINTACCELSRDLTLERLDRLTAQLSSAQTNLLHLRLAMIEQHGTGINTYQQRQQP